MSIETHSDIKPKNDSPFPVTSQQYIKGGHMVVADIIALYSIPTLLRIAGMSAYVLSSDKLYRLIGGIENGNWIIDTSNTYIFDQSVASNSWSIVHGLGFFPSVQMVDNFGIPLIGRVIHVDNTELSVEFNKEYAGTAYLS